MKKIVYASVPKAIYNAGKASAAFKFFKKKRKVMDRSDAIAMMCASFACGVVLGFLVSPAKAGFGNNDNSTSNYYFNAGEANNARK